MALDRMVRVAASGLSMQRARMEIVASNLANARTTRTAEGGPYIRRLPVVEAARVRGAAFGDALDRAVREVRVRSIELDARETLLLYEPGHPDADDEGFVEYPNVNTAEEVIDMLSAVRSYEANANVIKVAGRMHETALGIVR